MSEKGSKSFMVHTPVDILASPILHKRIAIFFGVFCLLFTTCMQYFYLRELKKPERIFVIDGSRNLHIGPTETLTSDSAFFENLCVLGTQCIFLRSPSGLDISEFLNCLFSESACQKIALDLQKDIDDIKARNLHQKPEISQIKIFKENDGTRQFYIQGNLISAGSIDSIPVSESTPFQILFLIMKNTKISEQATYPYIIKDVHIER